MFFLLGSPSPYLCLAPTRPFFLKSSFACRLKNSPILKFPTFYLFFQWRVCAHYSSLNQIFRHGLPPPPGHRAQGLENKKHFPGERSCHHHRLWSGQRGQEVVRQAAQVRILRIYGLIGKVSVCLLGPDEVLG